MKTLKYIAVLSILLCMNVCVISCGDEDNEVSVPQKNEQEAPATGIYAIAKEQLGDWQEGYIKYLKDNESQSCYVVSTYDSDEKLRTTYLGQLGKDAKEGYYLFTDDEGILIELKSKDFTYSYDYIGDEGVWKIYDNDGVFIKTLELGKVTLNGGGTRALMDNIVDLRSWFNYLNLYFHQEWGELTQNIGTDIVSRILKANKWGFQVGIEVVSDIVAAEMRLRLYDGCVPQIKSCEKDGKIEVYINGISNLTNIYKEQVYNPLTKEYEMVEKPGKEVSMAVAISKEESYVTYSKCDNHTTYVKISSSQGNITVSSPIKFEPGVAYYLRPYLIEKRLFNESYNTIRQRSIQYGDVYKFRYTTVTINSFKREFCKTYSESQFAVRAYITASIESLEDVVNWGVAIYDKNNELLKNLECNAENGKLENKFKFDEFLNKSLFSNGKTNLLVVPFAKYENGRYAYGESETFEISSEFTCPDENHPHAIDLGLPSGTKWACCNVGASKPEDFGGYYAWGETSEKSTYSKENYAYYNGATDSFADIGSDIAGTNYDVAYVRMGAPWRMPSYDQQTELRNNCSQQWTTQNGVSGILVTGSNGGQIFLPAADMKGGGQVGAYGRCWSSSHHGKSNANYLRFSANGWGWDDSSRRRGYSVRAVCP